MSENKAVPVVAQRSKICPVCGKASYSKEGVHPQCAVVQADAPRKLRLAAQKVKEAKKKKAAAAKPE
jgi:hypothetical protein